MSKRAEDLAKQLYPDPKLEDYDDILVYRADRDNAIMGRVNVVRVYEQAEKDLGWHSVDESLPPVDEEVIVLVAPLAVYSSPMKICFGHRPNPDGWYAKSTLTGRKKHYTPETYDGWNIPGVKYWMPMPKLPKEDKK